MDIKQSADNIVKWAKSHPWAAAAIVGIVILAAIYVAKNSGGGSEGFTASAPASDSSPLDASSGGVGSGIADVIGQLTESATNNTPSPITSVPSATIQDLIPSLTEELPFLGDFPIPSFSDIGLTPAGGSSAAIMQSGLGGARDMSQQANTRTPRAPSIPSPTNTNRVGLSGGSSNTGAGSTGRRTTTNAPRRSTSSNDGNKTPAMLVGKGRHFTGYHLGVYYFNGYPVSGGITPGATATGYQTALTSSSIVGNPLLSFTPGNVGVHTTTSNRPRRSRSSGGNSGTTGGR